MRTIRASESGIHRLCVCYVRSGNDNTSIFGRTPSDGTVTKYIHEHIRAHSCILDGELVGWDERAQCVGAHVYMGCQ